jgi:threonine dehydrogenase-like Zn-dependent dehydrogenase
VIGIGTLGSLALLLARLRSPGSLVAFGLREEELELARALGATETRDARTDLAPSEGSLDVVFETAGAVAAVELATRLVRPGGRIALLGVAGQGGRLELPADRIVLGDMTLFGSLSYTSRAWSEVLSLLESRVVDFERLVTHRFRAEEFAAAFALMDDREGTVAKIVLEHPEP